MDGIRRRYSIWGAWGIMWGGMAMACGAAEPLPYPLETKVAALLAAAPREGPRTGATRDLYLDLAERLVRRAAGWVDARGAVIDPFTGAEWAQTTPRFAAPGAVLRRFGRVPDLEDAILRAMDYACARLAEPETRQASPDFWMRELVTAYAALSPLVAPDDPGRVARWRDGLARVDPERHYVGVDPARDPKRLAALHNWTVYAAGGEAMRAAAGIGGGDFLWGDAFFDVYMGPQLGHTTPEGLYRDPADPITYDVTTRLQVANALHAGYAGPWRAAWDETLRRGGLTTLLFVSPEGFVPFGGRSGAFHFREAIVAALGELEASRHARAGDAATAGRFKRQARLAALAIRPGIEEDPPRHLKNRFPPESRHGIDPYGQYSVYSLFCASVLAQAALFADDAIGEAPTLAETGGYVLALQPAFHKIFASAGGHYAEIDTAADPAHDATGLGRVLLRGVPYGLLPAMPLAGPAPKSRFAPGTRPPEGPVALGPEWRDPAPGTLAAWTHDRPRPAVTVAREAVDGVEWTVVWPHPDGAVTQRFRLAAEGLSVHCARVDGRPFAYTIPVLATDGAERAQWSVEGGSAVGRFRGGAVRVDASTPLAWRPGEWANRDGVYRILAAEAAGGAIEATFRPAR